MSKSDYLEDKILNIVFKNTAYTPPATVYGALMTATPNDTGGGTEVAGGSYARQALTMGTPSSGTITNTLAVTFSAVPAATISHIAIYDASTSGNLLYYASLTGNIVTTTGADIEFGVGDFTITET